VAVIRALFVIVCAASVAYAQDPPVEPPPPEQAPPVEPAPTMPPEVQTPAELLRAGNQAAVAGEWGMVSRLIDIALKNQLSPPELAEAHRLAGLAAFFSLDRVAAEAHFIAYLRIDLDGQLDAALYPPDVIVFFTDVKSKYSAELRARRPQPKRNFAVAFVPVAAQIQNGERKKGIVLASVIVAFGATNLISYGMLKSWCADDGTCDGGDPNDDSKTTDHTRAAKNLRVVNLVSGIGAILALGYGVYDGVTGYRRETRDRERATQPYVSASGRDAFLGVAGAF
jgi:hypothetical protein